VIEVAAFLNWLLDVYDGDLSQPEPRSRIMNKYEEWRRLREAPEEPGELGNVYSFRQIAKPIQLHPYRTGVGPKGES
jgi:hypothetical protein